MLFAKKGTSVQQVNIDKVVRANFILHAVLRNSDMAINHDESIFHHNQFSRNLKQNLLQRVSRVEPAL
ncbi:MAG TPA: hypothetical protein DEO86_18410 [Colwellia sp.]|nr:hypothetical protein [Colwellia sp.]